MRLEPGILFYGNDGTKAAKIPSLLLIDITRYKIKVFHSDLDTQFVQSVKKYHKDPEELGKGHPNDFFRGELFYFRDSCWQNLT